LDKFITVKKDSAEFQKYIENRSPLFRAVPVESQNINTELEMVTFELKDMDQFKSISLKQKLVPLLKVNKFLYFFFPIFFVVTQTWLKNYTVDSVTLMLSWISVTCLFLAVNLRADYIDHVIGLDRILKKTATKPVSLGWVSAFKVKQFSYGFFAVSFLLGIPVVIAFPITLIAMAASAIIIFWAVLRQRQSFRSHILGDLGWSILLGPVLSVGFELSIRGDSSTETLLFGLVWAVVVFYRIQLQNFEVIMEASVAKIRNGITWLGFDKGKNLILILWGSVLILFMLYHLIYSHWMYWISTIIICGAFTFKARTTFLNLKSPVGSEMSLFIKDYHQLYVLLTLLWCASLSFLFLVQAMAKILM
jgi:1,4-dihydroxy-2-naphthoate polyprenyltransferase